MSDVVTLWREHLPCPKCGYPMRSFRSEHASACATEGCKLYGKKFKTPKETIRLEPI